MNPTFGVGLIGLRIGVKVRARFELYTAHVRRQEHFRGRVSCGCFVVVGRDVYESKRSAMTRWAKQGALKGHNETSLCQGRREGKATYRWKEQRSPSGQPSRTKNWV